MRQVQKTPRTFHDDLIRALDIGFAAAALLVLSPLFVWLGILVKLDSPGRVFFTQDRPGKNGSNFKIYKFRTMRCDAHPEAPAFRADPQGVREPVIKRRNDPRVTGLGRFLRKHSLDELPQLWNIIQGDMSFVGTRPPTQEEASVYTDDQKARLAGKPGLTGLAQTKGRTDLDFASIVAYDVFYIRNRSVGLYFKILLRTIPLFLAGKSSY
jgi:lipopolysaccharide/colanic/teichoic acid biosynthesis glycosyltransferase